MFVVVQRVWREFGSFYKSSAYHLDPPSAKKAKKGVQCSTPLPCMGCTAAGQDAYYRGVLVATRCKCTLHHRRRAGRSVLNSFRQKVRCGAAAAHFCADAGPMLPAGRAVQ